MKNILFLIVFLALTAMPIVVYAQNNEENPEAEVKLYALNCGQIHVNDLNLFSDTDQYIGQEKDLTVGCYLIRHGNDWLLWDTGLPGDIAEEEGGRANGPFHLKVEKTLEEQLKALDLTPEDITHLALSHGHFDHAGNADLFKNATLIIQKSEYDLMKNDRAQAEAMHMSPAKLDHYLKDENQSQVRLLKGDEDIFGDGKIKAVSAPGHSPGHMALLVDLPKSGPVVLSGDQWHFRENLTSNGVPAFNYDRADTLASSDKLNRLVKNHKAKLIIQHDVSDNSALPAFPQAME